jgi:hypothetical protein
MSSASRSSSSRGVGANHRRPAEGPIRSHPLAAGERYGGHQPGWVSTRAAGLRFDLSRGDVRGSLRAGV